LLALVRDFHAAHNAEFSCKEWSQSEHTQASLRKDSGTTIDIANSYVQMVVANGAEIVAILKTNYGYIDPDDEDVFQQFVTHQARLTQEYPLDEGLRTPFAIYLKIGEISYMRPEFAQRVREKFSKKKKRHQ
jgi:hypothetical protein